MEPQSPRIKSFDYRKGVKVKAMLMDLCSIEFYFEDSLNGEAISQTHLGEVTFANQPMCDRAWNDPLWLESAKDSFLVAGGFPPVDQK